MSGTDTLTTLRESVLTKVEQRLEDLKEAS